MTKWIISAIMLAALPVAAAEHMLPSLERPVAQLVEMRRAETTKQTYVFTRPGKGKARKIPSGTVVFLTGEESETWSEVWVEDIGISWISTSIVRPIDSRR